MELQRTSSISGPPLSPAYTGQVPYNYNQLEGRFKQLQGKSSLPKARPAWGCSEGILVFSEALFLPYACDPSEESSHTASGWL